MSGSPTNSQRESEDQPGNDFEKLSKADLIRLIKTKEVERIQIRKELEKRSFDPSVFLNTKLRDYFWDKVHTNEKYSEERGTIMAKLQESTIRHQREIGHLDVQIKAATAELESFNDSRAENDQIRKKIVELENILKQLCVCVHIFSHLSHKSAKQKKKKEEDYFTQNQKLNEKNQILKLKVDEFERKIDTSERGFIKEKEEYEKERKALSSRIQKMTVKRYNVKNSLKLTVEFKASEVFYAGNNQQNLEQLIMRFNTVSAENAKYVELIELLDQFHGLVAEELANIKEKGVIDQAGREERDKVELLLGQLMSEKMCKNYIKGLLSKDITVFKKTIEFLINLGPTFLATKHELFEDDTIVSRLCQDLRVYTNFENKKKVLNLITEMIQHSEKFTKTFVALGGVQILISEFNSYKDPVFVNSEYFCHLLTVLRKMLPNEVEFSDFVNIEILGYFVKLLSECYNKSSLFEILQILNFLGSKPNIRKRLMHLKIFKRVIKFYEDSWRNKDLKLLFYVFLLMGKFTREEGFKLQLISHFEIQNDVSTLFEPFKEENSHLTTEEIKCATLEIIRNLVMQSSPQKMRETLVKSSFLKSAIQVCMNDDSNLLKNLFVFLNWCVN